MNIKFKLKYYLLNRIFLTKAKNSTLINKKEDIDNDHNVKYKSKKRKINYLAHVVSISFLNFQLDY